MLIEKRNRKGTLYYEDENGEVVSKICAKCAEVKTLDDYQKHKLGLGGRESACKLCKAGYYVENKDSFIERYENNREHIIKRTREYYAENRPKLLEYNRKYYSENKEEISEKYREYVKENRERLTEMCRNWRRNNPDKESLIQKRRRARKQGLVDDITNEQMDYIYNHFGGCALTGSEDNIHWDHVIPLTAGNGGTTFGNMIPLRGDLNTSKNDSNIFEWFNAKKEVYNLSEDKFNYLVSWLAGANDMTYEEYRSFVYNCFENKRDIDSTTA